MIERLDHLVLTVNDLSKSIEFYVRVLGMEEVTFGNNRKALKFGNQKINLHEAGNAFEPKAKTPMPGSADLCFLTKSGLDEVVKNAENHGLSIIEGPIERTGATGPIMSIYLRDPDENLIEISKPL